MTAAAGSCTTEHGETLWQHKVDAGAHWSGVLRRGLTLRLTDIEGGANAAVLLYSASDTLERYNMADTLKAQHTACLSQGHVCYSDMGRILCSITADTCGWHDPLCGVSNAALVKERYGVATYQQHRNDYFKNGYDSFVNELGKFGLGCRDVMANINFFSKVSADETGALTFRSNHSQPGSYVELRFEMPTLVIVSTCQHPLDLNPNYAPRPLLLSALQAAPVSPHDECRNKCPENQRGFINTERLFL